MPIYEYRCLACRRRTSVFTRSVNATVDAACEHCGSRRLARLMSKFAVIGGGKLDLDNPDSFDVDENDPKSVARWARQMKEEMGEDAGPEFDDVIDRIEAGEDPDEVMADSGLEDPLGGDDDF